MDWVVVSTLAQVVAAAAVVVSLVYLAAQIRQNTKQVEEQARSQRFSALGVLNDQWRGFRSNINSNRDIAGIWRRGNEDPSKLDPDEYTVFDLLMVEFFWGFTHNWIMSIDGGLGSYLRDDVADNLLVYATPGLRVWWQNSPHRDEYPKAFAQLVDELLARSGPPAATS